VQQHGGKMTVTSPGLGKGVSITLEFPLFDTFDADKDADELESLDSFGCADSPGQRPQEQEWQGGVMRAIRDGDSDLLSMSLRGTVTGMPDWGEVVLGLGLGLGSVRGGMGSVRGGMGSGRDVVPWPLAPLTIPPADMHPSSMSSMKADKFDPLPHTQGLGLHPSTSNTSITDLGHPSRSISASTSASNIGGAGRHMLVVDDAISNRKMLMRIFRLKGFICEEACDGEDALEKYAQMCAQNTPPEAILMGK
jgi:CheY-like chemotaxis protein